MQRSGLSLECQTITVAQIELVFLEAADALASK